MSETNQIEYLSFFDITLVDQNFCVELNIMIVFSYDIPLLKFLLAWLSRTYRVSFDKLSSPSVFSHFGENWSWFFQ